MPIGSGGGGGTTSAQVAVSGKVLPVANAASVTVDTTTYADPIAGGGAKLTTLVFPSNAGALAVALAGDAFPRWLLAANALDGFYVGNGTSDAYNDGVALSRTGSALLLESGSGSLQVGAPATGTDQASSRFTGALIINAGLGVCISSGPGVPARAGNVGDFYIRSDGPPYLYFCTTTGVAGVAVWSTYTNAAPADASLRAGDLTLWFDKTNGAAKLNAKGKTTDGTVVTASIAMA